MTDKIVEFSTEEKKRLIDFLEEKKTGLTRSKVSLEREGKILNKVASESPNAVPEKYVLEVRKRIEEYKIRIKNGINLIKEFDVIISKLTNKEAFNANILHKADLVELYRNETGKKALSVAYNYYPRLKKAKEASLYVFANKIKTIMEHENVKVA